MNAYILRHPRYLLLLATLAVGLLCAFGDFGAALAQQPKKKLDKSGIPAPPEDANLLSMEVNALRTLYLLRGTDADLAVGTQHPEQRLRTIKNSKVIADCARKDKERTEALVSDAYRKALIDLRAAFIEEDQEKIEKFDKQVQALQTAEEPDLDDAIDITDAARKHAGLFVRQNCSADQVVAYLAAYGKELPNPRTLLFKAMRLGNRKGELQGPKLNAEEWKALRDFTIGEVTWQIGGLNVVKGDKVAEGVAELLDKAHGMSDDDLKANAFALRGEARKISDRVGPTDLLRFIVEKDVAEMLANPRLIPAVQARLRYLAAQ